VDLELACARECFWLHGPIHGSGTCDGENHDQVHRLRASIADARKGVRASSSQPRTICEHEVGHAAVAEGREGNMERR